MSNDLGNAVAALVRAQHAAQAVAAAVEEMVAANQALIDLAIPHRNPLLLAMQQGVARFYAVRPEEMLGKRRTASLVLPRLMGMALIREVAPFSLSEIAEAFGKKDHTAVAYACRVIAQRRFSDATLNAQWNHLRRELETLLTTARPAGLSLSPAGSGD